MIDLQLHTPQSSYGEDQSEIRTSARVAMPGSSPAAAVMYPISASRPSRSMLTDAQNPRKASLAASTTAKPAHDPSCQPWMYGAEPDYGIVGTERLLDIGVKDHVSVVPKALHVFEEGARQRIQLDEVVRERWCGVAEIHFIDLPNGKLRARPSIVSRSLWPVNPF